MVTTTTTKTMELEGNLRAFQLPDILRFLAMGKMSGMLTFTSRERTIELTIKDGLITGTWTSDRFPKLGEMLVYNGLISRKHLEDMLESQRDGSGGRMLGELLIENGLVSHEQISAALDLQIREELWELFSWNDGTFKFEHGLRPSQQRSLVMLEIEPLIEESNQHLEQWRVIATSLGDPDLVFRVNPEMATLPEVRLPLNTWRVLALINGRHSVQVLIYLAGMGRFETLCALDRLYSMQIIEPASARAGGGASRRMLEAQGGISAPGSTRVSSADVATENNEEEVAASGRRGLFGIRRRGASRAPVVEAPGASDEKKVVPRVGSYLTDVGLACALVSRLAFRLAAEPEFKNDFGSSLLDSLWRETRVRYPRADLIVMGEGRLQSEDYDAFVKLAGGSLEYLGGSHEDSMELLAQIGEHLARLSRERLGDRSVKVIKETIQPYLDCTDVKYMNDFLPRSWTEQWGEI